MATVDLVLVTAAQRTLIGRFNLKRFRHLMAALDAGNEWCRRPTISQAMFQASAKGRAAVAAKAAPKSDQQAGAEALERLGRGSGWIWAAC
ncbi:hypothetical protein [Methylorubrum extorquens]